MKTLHNIYEIVEKEFITAWDKSYGKVLYGEMGFQTCDLGSLFQVDKYVVKDYMKAALLQFIDSEIERHEKAMILETCEDEEADTYEREVGYNKATQDSITYLQEQRKLIEEKI